MYADFENDRDKGDFSVLPELHSVLSGMKVLLSLLSYCLSYEEDALHGTCINYLPSV